MIITDATAEEVFKNWSAMHDLFSDPEDALEESVECAQCGEDDAYERFGSDYLCESCLAIIGNILAKLQYGIRPKENGTISIVA